MALPKIRISVNARGSGTVEIDGQRIPCVRAINIRVRPEWHKDGRRYGGARVMLDLVGDVEVEATPSEINAELLGIPCTIVQGDPKK